MALSIRPNISAIFSLVNILTIARFSSYNINHRQFINDTCVFNMQYYSKQSQVIFFQEEIKPVVSRKKLYQDHIQNENKTEKRNKNREKNYNCKGVGSEMLFVFLKKFLFIYLAALGLCCCVRAFSSCGEQGLLFIAVRGLLTAVASLVAEHGLQAHGLQQLWHTGSRAQAQQLWCMGSRAQAQQL